MRRVSWTAAFAILTIALAPSLRAVGYSYTTITHPSAPNSTSAFGINNLGQIVGSYTPPLGGLSSITPALVPAPNTHGFLYDNGTFTTIDAPNGPDTEARGINDIGTIVGRMGSFSFGVGSAFVRDGGGFTTVQVGSSPETTLWGIDNAGLMVGNWEDTSTSPFTFHGFFGFNAAGPFNNLDFPGALTSGLTGVNNLGAVTGTYAFNARPPVFGYISIAGQFGAAGPDVAIYGINDSFAFCGAFFVNGVSHGFVFQNGTASAIDFPGASSTIAYGINNAGTVVGTYTDANGTHGFMATPAP